MKILSINSLWQLIKWIAIAMVVYAVVKMGVSPSIICFLLLVRLAVRLILQFISGVFKIAMVFVILWLLTLIF